MASSGVASRFDSVAYPAANERLLDTVLALPSAATRSRAGVRAGGGLEVTALTGPDRAHVAPGGGIINDTGAGAGSYIFVIPAAVDIALATRPSSGQTRLDEVVARILNVDERAGDGTGNRYVEVYVITGTPSAGTPGAPAVPAGQLVLAELTVPASGTVLVSKAPPRVTALGGILPVVDADDRDSLAAYDGLTVYRLDSGDTQQRIAGAWVTIAFKRHKVHVKRAAAQALTHNATSAIDFDTEVLDTSGMWTPVSGHSTDVVIQATGRYRFTARGSLDIVTAGGTWQVQIAQNGTDVACIHRGGTDDSPVTPQCDTGSTELDCTLNDVIVLREFHNAGSPSKNTRTGIYCPELIVERVG